MHTIRSTTAVAVANALRALAIEHGVIQPDGNSSPDLAGVRRGKAADETRAALQLYDADVGIQGASGVSVIAEGCSPGLASELAEHLAWALSHAETPLLLNPAVKGNPEALREVTRRLEAARNAITRLHAELSARVAADADQEHAEERPDRPCDADCARRVVSAAECTCSRSEPGAGAADGDGPAIVVVGNPIDGFQFCGPFASHGEATEYGDDLEPDWWVAPLRAPETAAVYVATDPS